MTRPSPPKLGCWIDLPSPQVAEIVAGAGFDFVVLDLEHGIASLETLQVQLMALAGRCRAVVRIPELSEGWIKRVLDSGADAVMVPRVETAAEAAEIVAMSRYAPDGRRGEGLPVVRASGWGRGSADYRVRWGREAGIIVQIESPAGLEAVEEIVAVKGVTQLFFGPSDYSASAGFEITDPKVMEAAGQVAQVAAAHGLEAGSITLTPGATGQLAALGYSDIAVASDVIGLVSALDGQLEAAKAETG